MDEGGGGVNVDVSGWVSGRLDVLEYGRRGKMFWFKICAVSIDMPSDLFLIDLAEKRKRCRAMTQE